jgi:VanZ family protein
MARKIAHFVLFGALGYSATSFIKGLHPVSFPRYTQVVYPVIFTIVYGALDEVHQLTVAGRNGSAGDVLVDTLAGVGGVLLYIAIFCFFRLWKKRSSLLK